MVIRARASDKLFQEKQVTEDALEDSQLYYHIVQGDTIRVHEPILLNK